MNKKILFIILSLALFLTSTLPEMPSSAQSEGRGKVIVLDLNKTSLENMQNIKSINRLIKSRGFVALMNIRGDRGYNDRRNFATIGSSARANIIDEDVLSFLEADKFQKQQFKANTGKSATKIIHSNINKSVFINEDSGEFKSVLGTLGQTIRENKLRTALIGNADYSDIEGENKDRNLGLAIMDNYGRIDNGKIEDMNIKNPNFPFGVVTDYKKLEEETKKARENSDVIFVELGDTQRLDLFKPSLNKETYRKMKFRIYKEMNPYLDSVINTLEPEDTLYIMGGFPSAFDYANNRRLSPIIKVRGKDTQKGLLRSKTTRREGIVANLDVGVDILNELGLKNELMIGRAFDDVKRDDNIEFIEKDYNKVVSISGIRMTIINIFVILIVISWILSAILIIFKEKLENKFGKPIKKGVITFSKELLKAGIILPFSFLAAGALPFSSEAAIAFNIVLVTVISYIVSSLLFKDSMKQLGFLAGIMILFIVIDSILGTPMMQNNIMSYDPIVGARYYGIGNEYEGVTIGATIFALAALVELFNMKKLVATIIAIVVLITSAYPSMGANVGGAISESAGFIVFLLLLYNVKIDIKKAILIFVAVVAIVAGFAAVDIMMGLGSHLGNFVEQIFINGPSEVILTFTRKIEMNIKIARISIWINVLIAAVILFFLMLFRPNKHFRMLRQKNPIIFNGFLAMAVGSIVTLLVNDSGIVAAATATIYILIPVLISSMDILYGTEVKDVKR